MVYHNYMIGVIGAGIMMLLLTACAADNDGSRMTSNRDADYRDKLIGSWKQRDVGPDTTLERTVTFLIDGSYRSNAKLTKRGAVIEYENRGSWRVESDVLYITVMESNRADIPLGCRTPNRIITLTDDEVVTESSEGVRTTAYRQP